MEVGCKDTHQGAVAVIGVFKWGYGSESKSVAFWGWVEEQIGGGVQSSKLVMARGNGVCAVDKRRSISVNSTKGITAAVICAYRDPQTPSTGLRRIAAVGPRDARPVNSSADGSSQLAGRVSGSRGAERPCVVQSGAQASSTVKPEKR